MHVSNLTVCSRGEQQWQLLPKSSLQHLLHMTTRSILLRMWITTESSKVGEIVHLVSVLCVCVHHKAKTCYDSVSPSWPVSAKSKTLSN